jgi:serine protease
MKFLRVRMTRHTLLGTATMAALIVAIATTAPAGPTGEEIVSRLIVKPRAGVDARLAGELHARDAGGLSKTANVPMTVFRFMSGDAHVIKLDRSVTLSEARVIAERLMRNDSRVEFAEPDRRVYPTATTPTDPGYLPYQWHYFAPAGANLGGANLPNAWDITKGSASITVAVIDTGYRQHADLGTVLPGYDFITDAWTANDGGGRDSDARDPGDWVAANDCGPGEPPENSSWHGTHVAGTIAALMNNGIGGTGIAPNVKILPVRVLGKCGGYMSDVVDGMRWAAGLAVPGVPANPNPAQVLNMSLGASGACSATFQNAATDVVTAGKVIVAAAGNGGSTDNVNLPANCDNVIAVTAHTISGLLPSWATIGPETAISAPGGTSGVYSLSNTGTTVPVSDSYAISQGTSMATPHVAGVAALMFSVKSSLTPAQVRSYLQSSARAFPAGSYCATSGIGRCGSGLLDAAGALAAIPAAPPTVVLTNPSQVVSPNTTVSLVGSATAEPPRTISAYLWTQLTGTTVGIITNPDTASATFTSPATGTYSFLLTATDSIGQTGTATATVRVNSAPALAAVPAQTVTAGDALDFTVGATDVDGDTPIFHGISLPAGATLSALGAFSWPIATPAGSYTMTYYASDPYGANSSQGTVNITVTTTTASSGGGTGGGGGGGGCAMVPGGRADVSSWDVLVSLLPWMLPGAVLAIRSTLRKYLRAGSSRHPAC